MLGQRDKWISSFYFYNGNNEGELAVFKFTLYLIVFCLIESFVLCVFKMLKPREKEICGEVLRKITLLVSEASYPPPPIKHAQVYIYLDSLLN